MSESNFLYVIPSYNRSADQRTVKYLNGIGIGRERIYVFVQTVDDKAKYEKAIGNMANIVLKAAKRGVEARNNILNEMSEKSNILMLDDDVRAIGRLSGETIKKIESASMMDEYFAKCFKTCEKHRIGIFGIYPVYNAFFMEKSISTKAPVNTIFGFTKGYKGRYNEEYDTKEDAELCARILAAGKSILRFNFLAVDADHRKTKDGYIDDWHQEENIRCVKKLVMSYPEVYKPQKNKPWEVRSLVKDKKIMIGGGKN